MTLVTPHLGASTEISIHTLLAESDNVVYLDMWGVMISIHTLLAESDLV